MLIGSIADMAHPLDLAKAPPAPSRRTVDHDFSSRA
jgi:hypothetical protein